MSKLDTLKASLAKKEAAFDAKLSAHFADVKAANGQPLNDKRNGASTLSRWERQNATLSRMQVEIEKTKAAIEREENKQTRIALATEGLPAPILRRIESGELHQWGKFPNRFFVPGVEKGRIVWMGDGIGVSYLNAIPSEQYPKFVKVVNELRAELTGNPR